MKTTAEWNETMIRHKSAVASFLLRRALLLRVLAMALVMLDVA
jgi:hypothetical protein